MQSVSQEMAVLSWEVCRERTAETQKSLKIEDRILEKQQACGCHGVTEDAPAVLHPFARQGACISF